MNRVHALTLALTAAAVSWPSAAAAQESNFVPVASANQQAPAGWSFTPSITYAASWDDNVLIRGRGDSPATDLLNVINPRGTLDLNGRRGQLALSYDGAFVRYRNLGTLDSYDQHASLLGRRLLSPHVALFVRNTAASVPKIAK